MKKLLTVLACAMLIAITTAALCACSGNTFGKIKSAYNKADYNEVSTSEEIQKTLEAQPDYNKIKEVVDFHFFQKDSGDDSGILGGILDKLDIAIVAEFHSTKDMEDFLKDHVTAEDAKNVYDELQKLDEVNGNCFLLFATTKDGRDIFKGTK